MPPSPGNWLQSLKARRWPGSRFWERPSEEQREGQLLWVWSRASCWAAVLAGSHGQWGGPVRIGDHTQPPGQRGWGSGEETKHSRRKCILSELREAHPVWVREIDRQLQGTSEAIRMSQAEGKHSSFISLIRAFSLR